MRKKFEPELKLELKLVHFKGSESCEVMAKRNVELAIGMVIWLK